MPTQFLDRKAFVNWRLVERPGKSKPDKLPCDAAGNVIDAQDPANWRTFTEASTSTFPVGVVLTADDPYFCVDLDGVRDAETGINTRVAADILDRLAGAAVEISQSGEGLHIIGRCDEAKVGLRRNRFSIDGQAVEFYDRARFIAFGPTGWNGDPETDCTEALAGFVPQRAETDDAPLPPGRDPSWAGPEDDDELLSLIRHFNSGKGPSFDALWNADAEELGQYYHDPARPFDQSAADLALMMKLAFATGRDAPRMERLFGRSELAVRDKWKRADYRNRTIRRACRLTVQVYGSRERFNPNAAAFPAPPRYEVPPAYPKTSALPVVIAASLHGKAIPDQSWLVRDLMPAAQPCLLTGDGGLGKSLLAMQLAVAVASGEKWIGSFVDRHGPVLYISCEDELDEMHRRLAKITDNLQGLSDLHISPMAELDALLVEPQGGKLNTTPLFDAVSVKVDELRPALVVLDSLADVYGGNEVVRAEVRWFVAQLRKLCHRTGCVVLILSHPSLSGMATGTGLSGSTHWNNSVRARLYLTRPKGDGEEYVDEDARTLEVLKNNRGKLGRKIDLEWRSGVFVNVNAVGPAESERGATGGLAEPDKAEALFMELLTKRTAQNVNTSHARAVKTFSETDEARAGRVSKRQLKAAMERLIGGEKVRVYDWRNNGRISKLLAVNEPTN